MSNNTDDDQVSLNTTLRLCVHDGSEESIRQARHLMEVEHVSAEHLRHETVAANPSVQLLEMLARHGYDPDKPGLQNTGEQGRRLIDYANVLRHDEVVAWLVDRVSLDHGQDEYEVVPMPPPLLETAAQYASRPIFTTLQTKQAKLGRRTLHMAVLFASAIKADPSIPPTADFLGFDASKRGGADRRRMSEMLPYLVDDVRLDINAMDTDRKDAPTGHYGTPLCYAVYHNGVAVVKWLLSKGASPRIGDEDQRADAMRLARALKADKCLSVLEEWQTAPVDS